MNSTFLSLQARIVEITESSFERRKILIEEMSSLEEQKKDCFNCSGMCCTYEFNSMLITPLECFEMLSYLIKENRVNSDLVEHLKANAVKYRLDKDFFSGKGRELRRYYTCPFFKNENKGCSISRSSKPYGCLGFNPLEKNVTSEGKCTSNLENLEKRNLDFIDKEKLASSYLSDELGLYWEKKPIPVALLDFILKFFKL